MATNNTLATRQTDLSTIVPHHMMPALTVVQAIERRQVLVEFVQKVLQKDTDFGVIPGTNDKPVLLKPGAEKLCTLFGLSPRFEFVERTEDWTGKDHNGECFFYYLCFCRLYRGEELVAESFGSCNSWEKKYRWRWLPESEVPSDIEKSKLRRKGGSIREPDFALRKRETGGKYGKPVAYWDRFEKEIQAGTARKAKWRVRGDKEMEGFEIDDTLVRIPNDDIAEQVNTFLKMSQKRAFIATSLIAVNASEFFTQDLEDMDPTPHGGATTFTGDYTEQRPQQSDDENFLSSWDKASTQHGIDLTLGRAVLNGALRKRNIAALHDASKEIKQEIIQGYWDASTGQIEQIKSESAKKQSTQTNGRPPITEELVSNVDTFIAEAIAWAAVHGVDVKTVHEGMERLCGNRIPADVSIPERRVALKGIADNTFDYARGTIKSRGKAA